MQQDAGSSPIEDGSKITFATFSEKWLKEYVAVRCRPSTESLYRSLLETHILPRLGTLRLSKVTGSTLRSFYDRLEAEGRSPRMRQMIHARLHTLFAVAVRWQYISNNPCAAIEPPRAPKPETHPLSSEQCASLIECSKEVPNGCLYEIAIACGLRQGELLALRWVDVDWEGRTLSINHTLQEVSGKLVLQEPKTNSSRRSVAMPLSVTQSLRNHRKKCIEAHLVNDYVFCDSFGGPLRKSNLIRRSFKPLLKRAGLPDMRFHDLRHTCATLQLRLGTNPKVVQEMLGHSRIATTLDTYSHVTPSMQREAAEAMDALLRGTDVRDLAAS